MTEPTAEACAALERELAEARAYQRAVDEVLRIISDHPGDAQRAFDAITERARVLCNAEIAGTSRYDGDVARYVSASFASPEVEAGVWAAFGSEPFEPDPHGVNANARAIATRVPVQIPDFEADPAYHERFKEAFRPSGARSGLAVPMLHEGQVLGAVSIARREVGEFPERLVRMLQTFAGQAVIAIENARLFNETREALEQQTATAEILKVISSSPTDLEPVFDAIVERAMALGDAQFGAVGLYDGELVHMGVAHGLPPDKDAALHALYPRKPERDMVSSRAIMDRAPVQVFDLKDEPAYNPQSPMLGTPYRSGLAVPMLREGKCIGVIAVFRTVTGSFPPSIVSLFETFADQAVIAIENSHLISETREALEQQTATAEVLRVISRSVEDTGPVFEKILDSCGHLFDCEESAILLVGDDGLMHVGATRGREVEAARGLFPMPIDVTASAEANRSGRPLQYPDVAAAVTAPESVRMVFERIGRDYSLAIAPMLIDQRGIGSILLMRYPPRAFTDKEMGLLTTFADQAVIAIENARLFHEIEDKSQQLELANQHKSDFLANMSHELRTPLNAIIGFSEVLLEKMFGELNEKQDDYLNDIHTSGKHLLSLINDILDLSKIEAGRMELEVETFDVPAALDNALTLIRERAQQHGIELSLSANSGLGPFRADQRKFKQVMLNLLSNAVKFTPDGGRIEVRAGRTDGGIEIAVADSGIGISAEDQKTVFEEFRQVSGSYTNKQEGTGLGLSLTRRIVELHGGMIALESAPGRGSTFTFSLPEQP